MSIGIEALQLNLRGFAQEKNITSREHRLIDLSRQICDPDTAAALAAYFHSPKGIFAGRRLLNASIATLRTTFRVGSKEILPWEGGFTIMGLSDDGSLLGGVNNPQGKVYKELGENLYHSALVKAVARMHLDKLGIEEGLEDPQNISYLQDIGLVYGKDVSQGESILSQHGSKLYIGASGCELREEYIEGLLPFAMRGPYPANFLAGYANKVFADGVSRNLSLDKVASTNISNTVQEPDFFVRLRYSH